MMTYEEIINSTVKEHFGVYVFRSRESINRVGLSFLPGEIFSTVPEEYRSTFVIRYNRFSMWAYNKLNLHQILPDYLYEALDDVMLATIKNNISGEIYKYECDGEIPLNKALSAFLAWDNYEPSSKFN